MTRTSLLYLASFAAHGALAAGVVSIKGDRHRETVAISVVDTKKEPKPAPEAPPPPPPPPPEAPTPKAKAPAVAKPAPEPALAATPAANEATSVPDFGLSLGGSTGGGLAVPAAAPKAASASAERVSKKVLAAPAPTDECTESLKKPKVVSITQPAYTAAARDAQVAGKVRVEVTVDKDGKVSAARVLEGLGYGLDDAALSAARAAVFEAGTKCGKPTSATFVIAIRFSL